MVWFIIVSMKKEKKDFTEEEKTEKNYSNWEKFWNGIDILASNKGISVSMLAKKAGLDPTIFNKSKRIGQNGRLRWPTTESISKVLNVTNTSMVDFVKLMHNDVNNNSITMELVKFSSMKNMEIDIDDKYNTGITDMSYILEIDTSKYEPFFYKNQKTIVNKNVLPRINQTVFIKKNNGDIYIGKIEIIDPINIVIESYKKDDENKKITIERQDIKIIHNFIWKKL